MQAHSKILVAGASGLVGSAICRELSKAGFVNVLAPTHQTVDWTHAANVNSFFDRQKPEYVFLCAAKVGGIMAHTNAPVSFTEDNLLIQLNVMRAAWMFKAKKLLFLGSACAYPKFAKCPIPETALLTGELEPSNEGYALAKIAGIKLCQAYRKEFGCNFISCMPTNLYGPGDNYNPSGSHVIPGMLRKIHEAYGAPIKLWGTGKPTREFLYSEDAARACIFLMENYNYGGHINVGTGVSVELSALASFIKEVVGSSSEISWDSSVPDGTPNRLLDCSQIFGLGWKPIVPLARGLRLTYKDYLCHQHSLRG
jgi:GDP-L-fucose synthase